MPLYNPLIPSRNSTFSYTTSQTNNPSAAVLSKQEEPALSYFFPFYNEIVSTCGSIPTEPAPKERHLPWSNRAYEHPQWYDWKKIWAMSPIVLKPQSLWDPMIEFAYQSTLFRLELTSEYIASLHEDFMIYQGATIVFEGFENESARYIVEWCQRIYQHKAYLKVVGIDSEGNPFPFSDPDFPSFILIVPACVVQVPSPSPLIRLIDPLPKDSDFINGKENCPVVCWVCGRIGFGTIQ
jgi:hypothetical protein